MSAAATVEEARGLAHRLIEFEKGRCGGDTGLAIFRAAIGWGLEEGALKSLRYRWRSLVEDHNEADAIGVAHFGLCARDPSYDAQTAPLFWRAQFEADHRRGVWL